ncbi:exfoliative toxin [Streptococcus pyogenes]|nr:exfoliative toxin [Streptococcus pyogenes]
MIDLKRSLFKIDVRAQKDEEKVFMRTACVCHYTSFQISENFCYNSNYERYNDKKVGYPFFYGINLFRVW